MKKRILSLLLALLMVLSLMPTAALADDTNIVANGTCGAEGDGSDLTWTLFTDGVLEISGTGAMASWTDDNGGRAPWFDYLRYTIKSVVINDGVTSIGDSAFYNSWYGAGLTSVTIPDSVTSIGGSAFSGCTSLTSITIPNSVTSIGGSVFSGCTSLTSITIPNSVTSIGGSVFSGCTGLTSVTIPNSVTSIGERAFRDCTGLTSVTIPNSVTSIGGSAFHSCTGLTSVTIPDSVTSIGGSVFSGCTSLTSVTIPDSVTSIGQGAFYGCTGLKSITIPNSVTSIGGSAFSGCTGLTSITIPDSVTSIGQSAFYGCTGLKSIDIPDSVTSIREYAFRGCTGLTSITIPNSVTSIGSSVFSGCTGLESINIDTDSFWGNIESYAFQGCTSLTTVNMKSCRSIGEFAFQGCTALKELPLPSNLQTIGQFAFQGCTGLETMTIPGNVSKIDVSAFSGCTSLTNVNLPLSLKTVGNAAFRYCSSLADVYYEGDELAWNEINIAAYNEPLTGAELHLKEHTHTFGSGVVTAPSCTQQGFTTYTCKCGETKTDNYVDALGHNYKNGVCTRCGAYEPHTHSFTAEVTAPTCTTAGYTTYTCTCGESYKDSYTDALGHDYKNGVCTRCDAKDPSPSDCEHQYTEEVYLPTCAMQGYTLHTCTLCGNSYKDAYTDKLVHKEYIADAAEATCTAYGYTGDTKCAICGELLAKGKKIVPYGHSFVDGVCTRCGATESTEEHVHDYSIAVETEPTCTTQGYTTFTCSICGKSYDTNYRSAYDHYYKDGVCVRCGAEDPNYVKHDHTYTEDVSAVTCTKPGCTVYVCTMCGSYYVDGISKATGHSYVDGVCTVCGVSGTVNVEDSGFCGSINGGTNVWWTLYDDGTIIVSGSGDMGIIDCDKSKIKKAIVEDGVNTMNYAFQNCTNLISAYVPGSVILGTISFMDYAFYGCTSLTDVTISEGVTRINYHAFEGCTSLEHITLPSTIDSVDEWSFAGCTALKSITIPENTTLIMWNAFEGCTSLESVDIKSCNTIGSDAFAGCTALESVNLPENINYISYGVFGDCSSLKNVNYAGTDIQWSKVIIEENNDPLLNATMEHVCSFGNPVVTAPTCTEDGYTTYSCSCGQEIRSFVVPALGHNYVDGVCSVCGEVELHTHAFTSEVVEPTCSEPGYTKYTCSCGETYNDDYTEALGHDYSLLGLGKCSRCGEKKSEHKDEHIHSFKSTVVEPTCTEEGYTEWKCECGESHVILRTEALGHSYDADGVCTRCGAVDPRLQDGSITVSVEKAKAGENVTVHISLKNNPGVSAIRLMLNYDADKLELIGHEDGILTGWEVESRAVWLSSGADSSDNGVILSLIFKVKEGVEDGEIPVTVSYSSGDITNDAEEVFSPIVTAGGITVYSILPGDINGDGDVNALDLIRLKKYIADDTTVIVGNGDVNGDGDVNLLDLIRLKKYLAGSETELH